MRKLGTFKSARWGEVTVLQSHYGSSDEGPMAIVLEDDEGQPLAKLSVNMSNQDSSDIPRDCFYVKDWAENATLALEAMASGLFIERPDIPVAESGFVTAPCWQVKHGPVKPWDQRLDELDDRLRATGRTVTVVEGGTGEYTASFPARASKPKKGGKA